jgi:DNA-binding helix-hairpin-helix protein with protein kinase domain
MPPELQGLSLGGELRRVEHDRFALAVLIFKLLMDGHHPFQSQWRGQDDPPALERKIALGWYPHTDPPPANIAPPLHMAPVISLPPMMAELVHRCFTAGHSRPDARPSPQEWIAAIRKGEDALRPCLNQHLFSNHLSRCPECGAHRAVLPLWMHHALDELGQVIVGAGRGVWMGVKAWHPPRISLPTVTRPEPKRIMGNRDRRDHTRTEPAPLWRRAIRLARTLFNPQLRRAFFQSVQQRVATAVTTLLLLGAFAISAMLLLQSDTVRSGSIELPRVVVPSTPQPLNAANLPVVARALVVNVAPLGLNVRAAPSLTATIIASLQEGAEVEIIESATSPDGWQRIRFGGRDGWVSGEYLEVIGQ